MPKDKRQLVNRRLLCAIKDCMSVGEYVSISQVTAGSPAPICILKQADAGSNLQRFASIALGLTTLKLEKSRCSTAENKLRTALTVGK
ncbi:hypothetical protein ABBQ32_008658 [Trebouxia sp. C0010 RCD-2024]